MWMKRFSNFAAHAEPETLSMHRGAIDRHFLQGSAEAVLESLKSDPSPWAQKQAAIMATKSPTSLKICHRQLREGLTLDFRSCMKLEYRIVNRIFTGHDFFEGTRAVVIDKDNAPQWEPASLNGSHKPRLTSTSSRWQMTCRCED
jgi:enoyl-CoA hydratase